MEEALPASVLGADEDGFLDCCYGALLARLERRRVDAGAESLEAYAALPTCVKRGRMARLAEWLAQRAESASRARAYGSAAADEARLREVADSMRAAGSPTPVLASYEQQLRALIDVDAVPADPMAALQSSMLHCVRTLGSGAALPSDAEEFDQDSLGNACAASEHLHFLSKLDSCLAEQDQIDEERERLMQAPWGVTSKPESNAASRRFVSSAPCAPGALPPLGASGTNEELRADLERRGFLTPSSTEADILALPEAELQRYTAELLNDLNLDLQWSRGELRSSGHAMGRRTASFSRYCRAMHFAARHFDEEAMKNVALFYRMEWSLRMREYRAAREEELSLLALRGAAPRLLELHQRLFEQQEGTLRRARREMSASLEKITLSGTDTPFRLFYQRRIEHCLLLVREAAQQLRMLLKTVAWRVRFQGPLASVLRSQLSAEKAGE